MEEEKESQKGRDEFEIVIPLKIDKTSFGFKVPQVLDSDFLKAIQDEYATRYLEHMKIDPTEGNKKKLLIKYPLTAA